MPTSSWRLFVPIERKPFKSRIAYKRSYLLVFSDTIAYSLTLKASKLNDDITEHNWLMTINKIVASGHMVKGRPCKNKILPRDHIRILAEHQQKYSRWRMIRLSKILLIISGMIFISGSTNFEHLPVDVQLLIFQECWSKDLSQVCTVWYSLNSFEAIKDRYPVLKLFQEQPIPTVRNDGTFERLIAAVECMPDAKCNDSAGF